MTNELEQIMMSMLEGENSREEYVRAPFGYPGSKSRGLEQILPMLPYRNGFCEPFGGTGAVLLARRESPLEIFNDRYSGVTCFYRVMRDQKKMDLLLERLELSQHSREEFMWSRDTWEKCEDEIERAARWYYMMRMSFGHQGRHFGRSTSGRGQMGVKFKRGFELFQPCHNRLINVQIENQDWRQCLKDYDDKEMVWYLDPPYYKVWRGMFVCEMPDADHEELLYRIFDLDGFVAISSYPNDLYDRPQWKWDNRFTWSQMTSTMGMAFTETNNLKGLEGVMERRPSIEILYIKEAHK